MENFSSFERVVGNIAESEKEEILKDRADIFDSQDFKELKGKEKEKTLEELKIIAYANKATNKIRQEYGLSDFDIPANNIHIITEDNWPKEKRGDAFYSSFFQCSLIKEQPARIVFLKKIFHEMIHFKSYNALQVTSEEKPELKEYRVGLATCARNGKADFFRSINEAVTEEITKKFVLKFSSSLFFAKEAKKTEETIKKYPQAVDKLGNPLFDEDTFYAETEKESWHEAIGRLFGAQKKSKTIITERFTYNQERKNLNILIDKIFKKTPERFKDKEDIFNIFARGMMTGNILPMGRLIEETFGNGTLRQIGGLDQDIKAQEKFIASL